MALPTKVAITRDQQTARTVLATTGKIRMIHACRPYLDLHHCHRLKGLVEAPKIIY